MSNPWFRMYSDFLEDPKIVSLAFEDQRHFIGVLALKCSGVIDQECRPDLMDKLVAQRLWIDHSAIREVKRRLIDAGLIDESWQPIAWDKRQFTSDHDPTAAERQRRKREKDKGKKELNQVTDESRVTSRTGHAEVTTLDTDTDTDKESANALMSSDAIAPVDRCAVLGCPHQEIIALYHETLPELKTIVASRWEGSKDAIALRSRWREDKRHQSLTFWERLFRTVRTNPHWMGQGQSGWRGADLRWLVQRQNFDKICDLMVDNANRGVCHG